MPNSPYTLSIDLHALNHLGINLYSNIPAVISEVVANAYDADATEVVISIDSAKDEIVIVDNGKGMTLNDINERFLKVGYDKRKNEPAETNKGRLPMGRKGIGKLSLFSVADIIEVQSLKDGETNGFVMKADEIKEAIENKADYHPDSVSVDGSHFTGTSGTYIKVSKVRRNMTTTGPYLRKRLARRFSVIGAEQEFEVKIDGTPITVADRDYFEKLEYIWYLGQESKPFADQSPNRTRAIQIDSIVDPEKDWKVSGWVATFDERKSVEEGNNTIVILSRGKLVHEDILKDLKEARVFRNYLIGEIRADFLDLDELDDIATSDRQNLKENDPRFLALKKYVEEKILNVIGNKWTDFRNENATEKATANPAIKAWFGQLSPDRKKYARQLFGKIDSFPVDDDIFKKTLYKHAIMAFERLSLQENLEALDKLQENDMEFFFGIFDEIDDIEKVLYGEIAKGRLEVLKKFEDITPKALEAVVQKHIFDHLWLLDPSWERASADAKIEQSVTKEFKKVTDKLTKEEKAGRIDIRYRTAAGKHIIIELKKGDRKVSAIELTQQAGKYRSALSKCLKTTDPDVDHVIEVICLVGSVPSPPAELERVEQMLKSESARFITYDYLVQQARKSYADYLDASKSFSRIQDTIDQI